MSLFPRRSSNRQRGAALVVGLIFLALVSMIATVGMRQSIMQERMAGGLRQESLARAGAETGARAGERSLFDFFATSNGVARGVGAVGDAVMRSNQATAIDFREAPLDEFFTTGATAVDEAMVDLVDGAPATAALAEQPVFIVEELGKVRPPESPAAGEGGATGSANYEGSGGVSPAGNADLYLYRITARATGGIDTVVRTVETTFVARKK